MGLKTRAFLRRHHLFGIYSMHGFKAVQKRDQRVNTQPASPAMKKSREPGLRKAVERKHN